MLNKRTCNFHELVWGAASRTGHNAPRIADEILSFAFPKTLEEAKIEGAESLLRLGAIQEIKRILRNTDGDDSQRDFSDIDEQFLPHVKELKSRSYFVESIGQYVTVAEMIRNPRYLDDARKMMRRKSNECRDEADRLDRLYAAVTAR